MTPAIYVNPGSNLELMQDMVGLIPSFLDTEDTRPAREQIDANYQHGGNERHNQNCRQIKNYRNSQQMGSRSYRTPGLL